MSRKGDDKQRIVAWYPKNARAGRRENGREEQAGKQARARLLDAEIEEFEGKPDGVALPRVPLAA